MGRTRLAWIAAVLAAACGETAEPLPGPLGRVYQPTGLAVTRAAGEARLVAASSNADLRFDDATGGAVLSIDPAGAGTTYGVNIPSFAGDLALLPDPDPVACGTVVPGPLAVTVTRGSDTLNAVEIHGAASPERPPGALSCFRCGVPLAGGSLGDPFAVTVACGGGRARAFAGYLRTQGAGWVSEYDLGARTLRSVPVGPGATRAFAYDAERDRLYVVGLATGQPTPLRWIDLRGCTFGASPAAGGCTVGAVAIPSDSEGIELRSMALGPSSPGRRRAFLTGRRYSLSAARAAGGRANDAGGVLLTVDLVDGALGGVEVEVLDVLEIGLGAQDVRVLPPRPGGGGGTVVAALAVDDGSLWLYDDQSRSFAVLGRQDELAGRPLLGRDPFGLAVDPELAGSVARLYVGSFRESFVTPVDVRLDVPLDAFDAVTAVTTARFNGATP